MAEKKRLEVGIDQFTLTLLPIEEIEDQDEWDDLSLKTVNLIVEALDLKNIYETEVEPMTFGKTHGYDLGLQPSHHDVAVCWHSAYFQSKLGISIRFGAVAWHIYESRYRELYDDVVTAVSIIQLLNFVVNHKKTFKFQYSRIDFNVDYFNYERFSPHILDTGIERGLIRVLTESGSSSCRSRRGYKKNGIIETLELGSRDSDILGVVYLKGIEQTRKKGYFYEKALKYKEKWVRCEVRFRRKYAHQITGDFLGMSDDPDTLASYVAQRISERFGFYGVNDEPLEATADLQAAAQNCGFALLSADDPRDHDLLRSLSYIVTGSGLMSVLAKLDLVYGKGSSYEVMEYLYRYYCLYYIYRVQEDNDIGEWVANHLIETRKTPLKRLFGLAMGKV